MTKTKGEGTGPGGFCIYTECGYKKPMKQGYHVEKGHVQNAVKDWSEKVLIITD